MISESSILVKTVVDVVQCGSVPANGPMTRSRWRQPKKLRFGFQAKPRLTMVGGEIKVCLAPVWAERKARATLYQVLRLPEQHELFHVISL